MERKGSIYEKKRKDFIEFTYGCRFGSFLRSLLPEGAGQSTGK